MSLSSPISVGDAIALSNVAWNIAKTFLPGATDAMNDFKELHGLLCSLTNALRLVGETFRLEHKGPGSEGVADAPDHSNDTVSIISETLSHCNDILGDLKRFIETYSTLDQQPDSALDMSSARGRNWQAQMKRSWKKLLWTAEGDNISGERLGEIFDWLKANLKSQEKSQDDSAASLADDIHDLSLVKDSFSFKLFGEGQPGGNMEEHLLCPEASLANIEPFSAEGYPSTRGAENDIAKFKKWADQLALFQATRPENTNVRNTFISSSARTVSVLHMKSYARKLLGVSFSADEKCLMLGRMTTLQILHHRTLIKDAVPDSREGMGRSPHLLPQRHITVVMHSEPTIESGVGKKYTIQVKYNTKFFVTDKPRFITMHDVLCTEEGLGSSTAHDPVAFSEVAFEFADSLQTYLEIALLDILF
ncbi:hypothetical protein LA080_009626 [Diaporthe eres]|nr:hypothetical protein LA080_009626 [Diaporthe eres]